MDAPEAPTPSVPNNKPQPKESTWTFGKKFWTTTGLLGLLVVLIPLLLKTAKSPANVQQNQSNGNANGNPVGSHNLNGGLNGSGNVIGNNNTVIIPPTPPEKRETKTTKGTVTGQATKATAKTEKKETRPIQINAPNGIAIGGGVVNNQTVNNYGAPQVPPRVLTPGQVEQFKASVAQYPTKIQILYSMNDEESYNIAKQIGDTLMSAGWTVKQLSAAIFVNNSGPPQKGMVLYLKGPSIKPGEQVTIDRQTPQGALGAMLMTFFPGTFFVSPHPDADELMLRLEINPNGH